MSNAETVGRGPLDGARAAPVRCLVTLLGLVAVAALVGGVGGGPTRPAAERPARAAVVAGWAGASLADGRPTPAAVSPPVAAGHHLPLVPPRVGAGGG